MLYCRKRQKKMTMGRHLLWLSSLLSSLKITKKCCFTFFLLPLCPLLVPSLDLHPQCLHSLPSLSFFFYFSWVLNFKPFLATTKIQHSYYLCYSIGYLNSLINKVIKIKSFNLIRKLCQLFLSYSVIWVFFGPSFIIEVSSASSHWNWRWVKGFFWFSFLLLLSSYSLFPSVQVISSTLLLWSHF